MKKTLAIFAVFVFVLIITVVLHDNVEAYISSKNNTSYSGTVISLENGDRLHMIVGDKNNNQDRLKLILTESTKIYDKNGEEINLSDIKIGYSVKVRHSEMMTRSNPAQTVAYSISILKTN